MKIKTVAYKGSKRKLLSQILELAKEIDAKTVFDGFSGTGIVSAFLRSNGFKVKANDLNASSYLYGSVFLEGFNEHIVNEYVGILNGLDGVEGWLAKNYSGVAKRKIRGTGGKYEDRPLGYTKSNAMKIDAAREYINQIENLNESDRNALIFSIVLAADKSFNNSNDQKSCLKRWTSAALKDIQFIAPTHIVGPKGQQYRGDILDRKITSDFVYLDPPYTSGVLYKACYHLNDSIATWNQPELDYSYAIPRPKSVAFRKRNKLAGGFYSQKTAKECFSLLLNNCSAKRIVLSYSDAPRNVLTPDELLHLCKKRGNVKIMDREHRLCTQPKSMNKISNGLKEKFLIIDT